MRVQYVKAKDSPLRIMLCSIAQGTGNVKLKFLQKDVNDPQHTRMGGEKAGK